MKRFLLATTVAAVAAFAAPAGAATITHDTEAEFDSITWVPGAGATPGSADRGLIANLFDGNDITTFLSLGRAGTLNLVIDPTTNNITSAVQIERTNGGSDDQERVEVFVGVDSGGYLKIAELFNINTGPSCDDSFSTASCSVATTGSGTSARTTYSITGIPTGYNTLYFVDFSDPATSSDGFDLNSLVVTSVGVPEPATLALLGAGLLGLGVAVRRRRRA